MREREKKERKKERKSVANKFLFRKRGGKNGYLGMISKRTYARTARYCIPTCHTCILWYVHTYYTYTYT